MPAELESEQLSKRDIILLLLRRIEMACVPAIARQARKELEDNADRKVVIVVTHRETIDSVIEELHDHNPLNVTDKNVPCDSEVAAASIICCRGLPLLRRD